ncbi:MAG: hypothetical protein NTX97_00605 [Bacteroidetes bacterium]|nr:hypothetical protein [Bacteroidota bacterium]
MKKNLTSILFIFTLLLFSPLVRSQTTTEGKNTLEFMIKQFNQGNLDSAFFISEDHINDTELKNNPKFWFYGGLINKEMYKKHEKGNARSVHRERASQSFQKSMSLETDPDLLIDITKNLKYIAST